MVEGLPGALPGDSAKHGGEEEEDDEDELLRSSSKLKESGAAGAPSGGEWKRMFGITTVEHNGATLTPPQSIFQRNELPYAKSDH